MANLRLRVMLTRRRRMSVATQGNGRIHAIIVVNGLPNEEMSAPIRLCMNRSSLSFVSLRTVGSNSPNWGTLRYEARSMSLRNSERPAHIPLVASEQVSFRDVAKSHAKVRLNA
jgi:hypothetical protein